MEVLFSKQIQDGTLAPDVGRIVIFYPAAMKSIGPSKDHIALSRSLAARYSLKPSDVGNNGYRYYWRPIGKNKIEVCPVRKIDEQYYDYKRKEFEEMIDKIFN